MTTRWDVERAVTNSHIDSRGRLIVLALLTKVDNATATTKPEHTPAFDTLAAMTGLSKAVLSEWLQALEDGGWVVRSKPERAGKGHRTIYSLRPGADRIVRRSRDLRTPRKSSKGSPGEPFEPGETVRPANPSDTSNSSPGEPFTAPKGFAQRTPNSSPSEPFDGPKGSPSEPATTTPPPTGEGVLKNHHDALRANDDDHEEPATPPRRWEAANEQPRTNGSRIPRQPNLIEVRQAEIERLPHAAKVIGRWLHANGYPHASADDARAVLQAAIAANPNVKMTEAYLRGIAAKSGFYAYYQPILDARANEIEKAVRELTRSHPDCEHGTAAGNAPHPTTGLALCPYCRSNAPAIVAKTEPTTHPDVQAALDVYRTELRGRFNFPRLMAISREATALHQRGATPAHLVEAARRAARNQITLLEAAQSMKGALV